MILLELFLAFSGIGVVAFGGGYAILPLIEQVVVHQRGWLTLREMTDIVSISQVTPGPIAINAATFVGTRTAGIPGAIAATVAIVLPQAVMLMILGHFLFKGKPVTFMDRAFNGLRPGVTGLIAVATLSMCISSLFFTTSPIAVDFVALAAFVIVFMLRIRKASLFKLVSLGAMIGLAGGAIEHFLTGH